jgi:hypothetical protein
MYGFPKWVLAGSVGGLVGAAVWAGISYAISAEIGWIAWGIGFLVGFCVRFVAGENEEGFAPGVTAAVIAIVAVVAGKYVAIHLLVSSMNSAEVMPQLTDERMTSILADDVVKEREAKGQKVQFPPGKSLDEASAQADYPPAIWQEAAQKWKALGATAQAKRREEEKAKLELVMGIMQNQIRQQGFAESFGIYDALWFFLAAATAYKIGHGNLASDD